MPSAPKSAAPLSPALHHILLALLGGERHGYAIMQAVESLSEGRQTLGPGTLYTALKRLVDLGWVEESEPRRLPDDHDERRRYYRLAPAGRRALTEETARLEHLVRVARRGLAG